MTLRWFVLVYCLLMALACLFTARYNTNAIDRASNRLALGIFLVLAVFFSAGLLFR